MDRLDYLGHATTLIRLGQISVVTDPFFGRGLGPLRRQGTPVDREAIGEPDLILISHVHRDHLDLRSLRSLPSAIPTVVPRGAAQLAARGGRTEVVELTRGESIEIAGVELRGTPAVHDGHRDHRRLGPETEPLGFLISGNDRAVYFAGDTDGFDDMARLAPLDLALLPVWGWGPTVGPGHLDPDGAAAALRLLRPRLAVPIHWGTFFPLGFKRIWGDRLSQPPLEFQRAAARLAPEVEVRVLQPGEGTALDTTPVGAVR